MNTVLKKSKKSVCVVVSMVVMLLCFTAIPAAADSYTLYSVGSTPVGFEIITPGRHTVTFYPASTSYTITFKTSPNGSIVDKIISPAYLPGMPSTLTTSIDFPNQQVYFVESTGSATIKIS